MTSSDEDLNILITCFCLIFISSGSGCSGFTSIQIDRSINRSVAVIALYALTTKSDLELFSPVASSDGDISIFRGYYCTYQASAAQYNLRKVQQTHHPNAKSCFKTKTQARKVLWVTLAL